MKMTERDKPKCGDVYHHFKGKLYDIIDGEAVNCTNDADYNEKFVVYQSYETKDIYIRKLEEFMSPVDKEKYPDAKQYWRFEKVGDCYENY